MKTFFPTAQTVQNYNSFLESWSFNHLGFTYLALFYSNHLRDFVTYKNTPHCAWSRNYYIADVTSSSHKKVDVLSTLFNTAGNHRCLIDTYEKKKFFSQFVFLGNEETFYFPKNRKAPLFSCLKFDVILENILEIGCKGVSTKFLPWKPQCLDRSLT